MDPKFWYVLFALLIVILVMFASAPPRLGLKDGQMPYSTPSPPSAPSSPKQPSGPPRSDSLPGSGK